MDYYAFYTGQCFDALTWLGAHREEEGGVFRTFAPGAAGMVLLHGGRELPMERVHDVPTTATPTASAWSCGPTTARWCGIWRSTPFRMRLGWKGGAAVPRSR